ncbi:membrane protein [Afipia sp. P52-10]|nr:membrane protein [Afipia sp. P52-10]
MWRYEEKDMSTARTFSGWKLATALGVAGAIALSVPSAEARGGRNAAIGFGIAAGALALGAMAAAASQPRYYYPNGYYDSGYYGGGYYGDSYNYYQPRYRSYDGYYDGPGYGYYGRPRSAPVPGTNYNPNGG